jgi:membrane protein insertase Oxa1/YidC/SpoIIIJ
MYFSDGKLRLWTRLAAIAFIPVTGGVPSGVLLFWITSNLWEMARINVLNHDSVRRKLGIPTRDEIPKPTVGIW